MQLPADYTKLTRQERREVREQYIREQNNECFYCGRNLSKDAPEELRELPIDWSLFPGGEEFLRYPIHLQHDHKTRMTEGAVHAFCNAFMWNYFRR